MRKLWTLAATLLLAGSVALAQAPASGSSTDQNTGTQSAQPAANPTDTSMPTGTPTAAGERDNKAFQGCLTGGNGAYTLATSDGQNYALAGEGKDLEANVNKEVTVNGIVRNPQSGASTLWVISVSKVADTCAPQTSSNTGAASTTETTAASSEPAAKDQSMPQTGAASPSQTTTTTDQSASTSQSNPASQNSATASQTNVQPANPSGETNATASQNVNEQPAATTEAKPSEAETAKEATSTSTTSATESKQGTEIAQADQSEKNGALPQTASPLPLLGLLGFSSLAGGLIARFRK